MKQQRIAGLDVGTSSLKICLAAPDTTQITEKFSFAYPEKGEAAPGVVSVRIYEDTIKLALDQLLAQYDLLCLAVSTQMYSVCEVREDETFVWQWNSLWDQKPEQEASFAEQMLRSGCPVDTIYGAYKLASMPEEDRRRFLPYGIKEHLLRFLTGELASDYSTASASGLFNNKDGDWNWRFVDGLGFRVDSMPRLLPHDKPAGFLRTDLFPQLTSKTVVAPGLGDGPSASYACRDISSFCGNVGTSMAARVFTPRKQTVPDTLWCYMVDGETNVVGGISPNSCSVFNWAGKRGFGTDDKLYDTAALRFFPWIHGERMPYWSSDLKGTFMGLKVDTSLDMMGCAVLKAVAFTFVNMACIMEFYRGEGHPLVLAGGATNSAGLLELLSGCIQSDLAILEDADYLGAIGSLSSAASCVGLNLRPQLNVTRRIPSHDTYLKEYTQWKAMGDKLAALYRELAQ